jgi:multidrug efflux pump subunit AcrA (membrane-fusion protein)
LLAKKSERELADLEIVKRKILAPFSGFVETRVAQLGEWVQPGSPIVQIVQMDRLRAQGFVSAVSPDRAVSPGMPAVVEFDLGNNRKERINGVVGFVGNDVDLQNRRKIWVEFANSRVGNDWLIKPGMIPVIRIDISQPVANSIGQVVTPSSTVR